MTKIRLPFVAQCFLLLCPFMVALGFFFYEVVAVTLGIPVALEITGYDPTDILRGHYIQYDYLFEELEVLDPENAPDSREGDGYFVLADGDQDGIYDTITGFTWKEKPEVYLLGFCRIWGDDSTYFSFLSEQRRFYLDERIAETVEEEIFQAGGFSIVGTVTHGLFRASGIEVDGTIY